MLMILQAVELCRRFQQDWRAASLSGYRLWHDQTPSDGQLLGVCCMLTGSLHSAGRRQSAHFTVEGHVPATC